MCRARLFEEISKRYGLKGENLKYLMPDEIDAESLRDYDESELESRRHGSFYLYFKDERKILTGSEYADFKEKLSKQRQDDDVKEITGMCASVGKAIGRVKVCVTADEISKVEEGDE